MSRKIWIYNLVTALVAILPLNAMAKETLPGFFPTAQASVEGDDLPANACVKAIYPAKISGYNYEWDKAAGVTTCWYSAQTLKEDNRSLADYVAYRAGNRDDAACRLGPAVRTIDTPILISTPSGDRIIHRKAEITVNTITNPNVEAFNTTSVMSDLTDLLNVDVPLPNGSTATVGPGVALNQIIQDFNTEVRAARMRKDFDRSVRAADLKEGVLNTSLEVLSIADASQFVDRACPESTAKVDYNSLSHFLQKATNVLHDQTAGPKTGQNRPDTNGAVLSALVVPSFNQYVSPQNHGDSRLADGYDKSGIGSQIASPNGANSAGSAI